MWLVGHYHSATTQEFHDLKDWVVDHASKGERFRIYYDVTVTSAFVEASATSYGYETYVLADASRFRTDPVVSDLVTYSAWRSRMYKFIS